MSLTVPVRFDTISEQKRDETKPTRPLTASESNFKSRKAGYVGSLLLDTLPNLARADVLDQ